MLKAYAHVKRCSTEVLAVPKNMKLLAIPLFELYDNAARYVPNICAYTHIPAHADLVR